VGAPLTPPDLRPLGLDPAKVTGVALIHRKHGNRLCRVECGERSLVFKWFSDPAQATEVRAYSLLQEIGVPTLPLHGKTENALLLEDLTASPTWRRACGADVERAEVGAAVAEWYLLLHARGGEVLTRSPESVDFLDRGARAAFWEAYGPWTRGRRYSTNPFRPCSPYKQRRGVRDSRAGRENAFRWCRAANWRGASEGP